MLQPTSVSIKSQIIQSILLFFFVFLVSALILNPSILKAEEPSNQLSKATAYSLSEISNEELAQKGLIDTGWACGKLNRHCTHILLNDNDRLLCVPTEIKNDCLMIPLDHFRYIGGCGLESGEDGKPRLIKYDRVYSLEAGSPHLAREGKVWSFPVIPYESRGFLYVPLRFLCETLDMDIQWLPQSNIVVWESLWVDAEQIAGPLTELNKTLLTALDEEDWQNRLEPVDITVTFYFSDMNPPYTASGNVAVAGSLAADPGTPFGTQYYIPELSMIKEDGIFTVHDRGSAVTGELLDVFIPDHLRSNPAVNAALMRGRFKTAGFRLRAE